MNESELGGVLIVPLIVGLVEAAKRLGLPVRYAALASLSVGLAVSLGAWLTELVGGSARGGFQATLVGLALGLSASGLYSVAHSVGDRALAPTAAANSRPPTRERE